MIGIARPDRDHTLNGIEEHFDVLHAVDDHLAVLLRGSIRLNSAHSVKLGNTGRIERDAVLREPCNGFIRMGKHGPVHNLENRLYRRDFLFLLVHFAVLFGLIALFLFGQLTRYT